MSSTIQRKVKKPTVLHRAKKVVNSQDKSLHRSMLSHSRVATGYKKKIAALLGNNKALAHALEMAHVELTNKDKLMVELQRKLTLQSPKRFRGKIQKVCEHLQVIVALLQDILDDCDDFADSAMFSFDSQTNNRSKPDIINGECENHLDAQQNANNNDNAESSGTDIISTPFPIIQPQPRLTTAAEMSAILEQSVLLGDENLPPILFPEDNNEVISNVTVRAKSKSRSTSSQLKSRESKKYSESPRKSSDVPNINGGINYEQRSNLENGEIPLSPLLPLSIFNKDLSPKENSPGKKLLSPKSASRQNRKSDVSDSAKEFFSPGKTTKGKISFKRKSLPKKKSKKNILIVKLPCTPRRSLERNMKDVSSKDTVISNKSPGRRKTFTVEKSKNYSRRTFVLSPKTGVLNSGQPKNSPKLYGEMEGMSSPPLLSREEEENNSGKTFSSYSARSKEKENHSDNISEAKDDVTCTVVQDMDLTSAALTENVVQKPDTMTKELAVTVSSLARSAFKNNSNDSSSQLMYGYDPLEGTSRNRKSSISLKKGKKKSPRNKLSSKIPQMIDKNPTVNPSKPVSNSNTAVSTADTRTEQVSAETNITQKSTVPTSPTKAHILSSKHNSSKRTTKQETGNQNKCFGKQLAQTISNRQSPSHSAINKPNKERLISQHAEAIRKQKAASMDSVQPLVKLNDIWTSVQSPPSSSNCGNYVYIPDSLDDRVLIKVETPRRRLLKSEKELVNHEVQKDKEIKDTQYADAPLVDERMSDKADSDDITLGSLIKKRRQATQVSYKEPPLNKKLRQGDPFTSGFEKVKDKRNQNKRKARSCSMKKMYCEDDTSDSEDQRTANQGESETDVDTLN